MLLEGNLDELSRTGDSYQYGDTHNAVEHIVLSHCLAQTYLYAKSRTVVSAPVK